MIERSSLGIKLHVLGVDPWAKFCQLRCGNLTACSPYRGTHSWLRLLSPPSTSNTVRFLSSAASLPATTHPAEPPRVMNQSVDLEPRMGTLFTAGDNNVNLIRNGHDDFLVWCKCLKGLLYVSTRLKRCKMQSLKSKEYRYLYFSPSPQPLSDTRSSKAASTGSWPF